MEMAWDLLVDVNGDEVFYVKKDILCSYSGKLNKLLRNASLTSAKIPLKVIFNDLPGGVEAFELFTRFCYNNGRIQVTPINSCILHSMISFMEVSEEVYSPESLNKQVKLSVEGIHNWSWPEILSALKQCQNSSPLLDSSPIFEKVIDSLVVRIAAGTDSSPSGSSPESSIFRHSFDTKSNISTKNSSPRVWWFEDLVFLNGEMINKVVKSMISRKLDHVKISKFLFYYLKCKYLHLACDEKKKVIETVINLLYSLNRTSVSSKGLFDVLRVSSFQNVSSDCRERLEIMIGCQIDKAGLDNLLISSPKRTDSLYDVSILLRFLRHFLACGGQTTLARLKKVAGLLDLYMAEVAPDVFLKHSKFVELVTALPDFARDSHDSLYRSIDLYLEVHNRLTEGEKLKICCAINYEKLCSESCKHLAQNSKFPSRTAVQETKHFKSFNVEGRRSKERDQILLYARKHDTKTKNEKLEIHLQGMQFRVEELEKACRKMQNQMTEMIKGKKSCPPRSSRSLPRLCS